MQAAATLFHGPSKEQSNNERMVALHCPKKNTKQGKKVKQVWRSSAHASRSLPGIK
jgi:hypothetical protein